MAVVRVIPRGGGEGSDSTVTMSAVRMFTVVCDGKADTPFTVVAHPDIPLPGTIHPDNADLFADRRTARQESGGPNVWRVEVDYVPREQSEVTPGASPLLDPPTFNYDVQESSIVLTEDLDDPPKEFKNSIGEPLLEAPEWIRGSGVITIVRNENSFDSYSICGDYLFTVCDHEIFGWPKLTGLMRRIAGELRYHQKLLLQYYRVTYQMHFRSEGWHEKRRNLASKYATSYSGRPGYKSFSAEDGTSSPLLGEIKEDGTKWTTGDHHILDFKGYPERSWYGLGF